MTQILTEGRVFGAHVKNNYIPPQDDFNANILDPGMWTASTFSGDSTQVKVQNQRLEITLSTTPQLNCLSSQITVDMTGAYTSVQVTDAGDQTIVSHEAGIQWYLDSSNQVWIFIGDGIVKAFKLVASVQTQVGSNLTYDSTLHKFLRVRESAGTIFYEWSTDGGTWTNPSGWNVANPFAVTGLTIRIYSQCWQAEGAGGSHAYFDNYYNSSVKNDFKNFVADAGVSPTILMWYQHWGVTDGRQNFVNSWTNAAYSANAIPMITWMPWDATNGTATQPTYSLANIIAGNFDTYISTFASACATWGKPMYLRFAHEMNGNWYPWSELVNGNSAGQYATMWQHVHALFVTAGATNVYWVWSPNVEFVGSTALSGIYPGDSYVDWLAIDGYNFGTDNSSSWTTFTNVFSTTYTDIIALSNKPLMIAETGCSENGGSKSAWINDFLQTSILTFPRIQTFIWFNESTSADFRIETSASAQEAFKQSLTYWLTQGKPSNTGRYLKVSDGMSIGGNAT